MRIGFICGEYPPSPHGGIGTATRNLAVELVRQGHKVRVVGIREPGDTAPSEEVSKGVEILRLPGSPIRRLGWIQSRYLLYREVAAAARRGQMDLVEAPDFEGLTAGWKRLSIPVVMRLQGSVSYFAREAGRPMNRLIFELERMALKRAAFHCSASRYTADVTRRLFGLKRFEPEILYNPVPIPEETDDRSRVEGMVVFTGTLTAKKGIIHLVGAWPEVAATFPNAQLHVYGRDGKTPDGGSMRDYLVGLLPESVRSSVVFHGAVAHDTIVDALRVANVGVFPSFSEAFGVAPMESMAQACPTIYSTMSSGPELMTNGENGLLVDPANEKEIASAINLVLGDRDLARRLGAAGRTRVKDFSVECLAQKNLGFYQNCLNNY